MLTGKGEVERWRCAFTIFRSIPCGNLSKRSPVARRWTTRKATATVEMALKAADDDTPIRRITLAFTGAGATMTNVCTAGILSITDRDGPHALSFSAMLKLIRESHCNGRMS